MRTKRQDRRMDPWSGQSEQQLVTSARGGHPDAYGELVRRHQTGVFNTCYRLVGDRQEALDLAQDVFVRAYAALGAFDASRPFGPWIGRIAVNQALNWLQRRRLPTVPLAEERAGAEPAAGAWVAADPAEGPEQRYLAHERSAALREAILALPPHYRAVVELRHMQELSYEQIAAALGLPLSDVKSHLFRARQMLRQRLREGL